MKHSWNIHKAFRKAFMKLPFRKAFRERERERQRERLVGRVCTCVDRVRCFCHDHGPHCGNLRIEGCHDSAIDFGSQLFSHYASSTLSDGVSPSVRIRRRWRLRRSWSGRSALGSAVRMPRRWRCRSSCLPQQECTLPPQECIVSCNRRLGIVMPQFVRMRSRASSMCLLWRGCASRRRPWLP